jgi:alpha-mannosidase
VSPAPGAPGGRYFVSARITDGGQTNEDVVTVDLQAGSDAPATDTTSRSPSLGHALQRALVTAGIEHDRVAAPDSDDGLPGDELLVSLLDRTITVAAGQRASLRLALRNCVAGEIRGEAQIISPYDTWGFIDPWTQGFAVEAGEETVVEFSVTPPASTPAGAWWALVKVMYFGRLIYTESIPIEVGRS